MDLPSLPTAAFTTTGLDPDRPRYLLFWHKEKGLAKAVLVRGDEKGPLTVKLDPLGVVTGQLVDEKGKPRVGATVYSFPPDPPDDGGKLLRILPAASYPGAAQNLVTPRTTTDAEGRFKIRLVPGFQNQLGAQSGNEFLGWLAKDLPAPAGEPKDLGTIESKPQ